MDANGGEKGDKVVPSLLKKTDFLRGINNYVLYLNYT